MALWTRTGKSGQNLEGIECHAEEFELAAPGKRETWRHLSRGGTWSDCVGQTAWPPPYLHPHPHPYRESHGANYTSWPQVRDVDKMNWRGSWLQGTRHSAEEDDMSEQQRWQKDLNLSENQSHMTQRRLRTVSGFSGETLGARRSLSHCHKKCEENNVQVRIQCKKPETVSLMQFS